MKKAVIRTGGKQYVVEEGQTIDVELLHADGKKVVFETLLVADGSKTEVGTPVLTTSKVTAEVVAEDVQTDKVTAIRYKAKKRVHKVRGHRQRVTTVKIVSII